VGSDLNPVALVAARAKTRRLSQAQLRRLAQITDSIGSQVESLRSESDVRLPREWEPSEGRRFKGLRFWFSAEIAQELAALRAISRQQTDPDVRAVLEMAFSAIVVAVSWQDSDTRYVRRKKRIDRGDPTRLFQKRLAEATSALEDAAQRFTSSAGVFECDARAVNYVEPGSVRLVITSPPYPNAWSYHLYHQNRILWLDRDPWDFKAKEIGHHRSYSAVTGEGAEDFRRDMQLSLEAVREALRSDGYAVVVVGDSIVRGELVRNDIVVTQAASAVGLKLASRFNRVIDPTRKAFNPSIGKIKNEHVLVFRP
jgi:site-specific DNA-methyltransferase (cytosine-N4-specific)